MKLPTISLQKIATIVYDIYRNIDNDIHEYDTKIHTKTKLHQKVVSIRLCSFLKGFD